MVEIVVNGRRGEKVVPLAGDRSLVIGRNGKLRLNDRRISRQHARLVQRDDACYVEDLGSKNGTYVNQVRVASTEPVKPGDTIRIGNTTLIVRQAQPPADSTPRAVARVPARRREPVGVPDRIRGGETPLALPPSQGETRDATAARRWGPILLCGMTLGLLVTVLFSAIAYARTMAALRELESRVQHDADARNLELLAALRSDLHRPPSPDPVELAAIVDQATERAHAQSAAHAKGLADRADERLAQLQRSASEELAALREALKELDAKLAPPPPPPSPVTAVAAAPVTPVPQAPSAPPVPAPIAVAPDVVFVIDGSRGLSRSLPQALAQVRRAIKDLPPSARYRILVAQPTDVAEVVDERAVAVLASGGAGPTGTRAITLALEMNPRTLHLFTDATADGAAALKRQLRAGASGAPFVNITHFHTREFGELLKSIARDHGGMYCFISQG